MGLFTAKTKVYVGTSVSRVISDALTPDAVKNGLLSGIIGDDSIVDNVMENLVNSMGMRAEKMYAYAKDHYTYGLPSGNTLASTAGLAQVTSVLQTVVGVGTTVSYNHFGPANNMHMGWMALVNTHGYNSSNNQIDTLTAIKGTPVYLKDMVVVVKDATLAELANGSLDQWGASPKAGYTPVRNDSSGYQTPHSPFQADSVAASDYMLVTYVWEVVTVTTVSGLPITKRVLNEDTFTINIAEYPNKDYFQVKYIYAGKAGYWMYEWKLGTYPTLDAVFNTTHSALGTYFPFGYFRYNKTSQAADVGSAGYLTSVKMMDKIGIDFATVTAEVHENPGIADIEQAMLVMGVPAESTNPIEQRYLFDFFSRMNDDIIAAGVDPVGSVNVLDTSALADDAHAQISMVIEDTRFKMALQCLGISKRTKAGVIAAKGKYVSGRTVETIDRLGEDAASLVGFTQSFEVARHFYQYQVSETAYEEVQVFGLRMVYFIDNEHMALGDAGDATLLIPLDYAITQVYSIPDREKLYARSLHYVFNSKVVIKAKWYETGLFQAVMYIVAIVAIGLSFGTLTPAVLATLATLEGALIFLAMKLIEYTIATLAIKYFVKLVGIKAAIIIALIAVAAGLYQMADVGGVPGAPWGKDLVTLASNLNSGVQKSLSASMVGLQKEALDFQAMVNVKTELLDAANKLLETSVALNPMIIWGETPQEFYNRTVHSGNIGVLGIEAISSYVDVALTLPKLSTTVQGGLYDYS